MHRLSPTFVRTFAVAVCAISRLALAQAPDSPAPVQPPAGLNAGAQQPGGAVSNALPILDPSSELFRFNGQSWSVTDQRIFNSRFEKYLNTPPNDAAQDRELLKTLSAVLSSLEPRNLSNKNIDLAFQMLARAALYPTDARVCDTIASQVFSVWQARREQSRLHVALDTIERERRLNHWNLEKSGQSNDFRSPQRVGSSAPEQAADRATTAPSQQAYFMENVLENKATKLATKAKIELSELQAKIEFQTLAVQLFLQRKFLHVLICTRFYRAIFSDGESKLQMSDSAKDLFSKGSGLPPSIATLDTLANEAIRDINQGIASFTDQLKEGQVDSASKRLFETFLVGEHMPAVQLVSKENRRKVLSYTTASRKLLSALDARDFTTAESLIKELQEAAKDFDASKPATAIAAGKGEARMLLAKARNAAASGDQKAAETALTDAAKAWPRNPDLEEASTKLFTAGDAQITATKELEQLMAQKNFRRIADESGKFIAATATSPTLAESLKKILDEFRILETTLLRAEEMDRLNNSAAAWETLDVVRDKYGSDVKFSQALAGFTVRAPDFVNSIKRAQEREATGDRSSAIAWYLKAQKLYPASTSAESAIKRLCLHLLEPSSSSGTAQGN